MLLFYTFTLLDNVSIEDAIVVVGIISVHNALFIINLSADVDDITVVEVSSVLVLSALVACLVLAVIVVCIFLVDAVLVVAVLVATF